MPAKFGVPVPKQRLAEAQRVGKTATPVSLLVGIAGGSCSGKTTLALALTGLLGDNCVLMRFDDYYRDLAHLSLEERAEANFDHPDALDTELFAQHLGELAGGRAVQAPNYDFATHTRLASVHLVEAAPIVVIDGILLLAVPACRELLDLSVFVHAPADERLSRRIERDVAERGRTESRVRAQFAATVEPMHQQFVEPSSAHADLAYWHPFDPRAAAVEVAQQASTLA